MTNNRSKFDSWIRDQRSLKIHPILILSTLDDSSLFAKQHGISKTSIWEISDPTVYAAVYRKLSSNHLFRVTKRGIAQNLDKVYAFYKTFLEECVSQPDISTPSSSYKTSNELSETSPSQVENCERSFLAWLSSQSLAATTARGYLSGLRSAESYSKAHNYKDCSLFTQDKGAAIATATALLQDNAFAKLYPMYRPALRRYLQYLGATDTTANEQTDKYPTNLPRKDTTLANSSHNTASELQQNLSNLLAEYYQYGFRLGSPIALMKLRNYAEAAGVVLPQTDEQLEEAVTKAGIVIEGKVFAFGENLMNETGAVIDSIFEKGYKVIFVSAFLELYADWLEERHMMSEDVLRETLKKCRPGYYYGQNIITQGSRISETDGIVNEILRCAADQRVILFDELKNALPYIPSDKLSWTLSISPEFAWVSEGKYFIIKRLIINQTDVENILSFVQSECSVKGYASMTDLPYGDIPDDNCDLSTTALYSSVFSTVLQSKYFLQGKIITPEKNSLNITVLLKAFCLEQPERYVSDVMDRAAELTGSTNKQYSLDALYETMIRADADRFVSEDVVHFDIAAIDGILSNLIGDRFIPLKAITTFALFPACGISWNHYVLESYCYRFSKKYQLLVINYNDQNAGIIKAKDLPLSYTDILCHAAAEAGIELIPESLGQYFFENGFTARRKYANLPEITEQARKIREER